MEVKLIKLTPKYKSPEDKLKGNFKTAYCDFVLTLDEAEFKIKGCIVWIGSDRKLGMRMPMLKAHNGNSYTPFIILGKLHLTFTKMALDEIRKLIPEI